MFSQERQSEAAYYPISSLTKALEVAYLNTYNAIYYLNLSLLALLQKGNPNQIPGFNRFWITYALQKS